MNIISGKYKGKSIKYSKTHTFRATQNRVREALFNILQTDIADAYFLDLCCGSGGIGIEAVSRGAAHISFVDIDTTFVKKNQTGIPEDFKIFSMDANKFLKACKIKYNIVFFDPPWNNLSLYSTVLKSIFDFDILSKNGIFICEHQKKLDISDYLYHKSFTQYKYGDTVLTVVRL